MVDEIASGILEILLDDGPKTYGELKKLTLAKKWNLNTALEKLERSEAIYQIGFRWFVSTKLIIQREFFKVLSQDEPPDNEFGKFIKEYAAAIKIGATEAQAWYLAKKNSVEVGT